MTDLKKMKKIEVEPGTIYCNPKRVRDRLYPLWEVSNYLLRFFIMWMSQESRQKTL